jgi:hypothetical protein
MERLRELAIYVKNVEGEVADMETEGHWLDVKETNEGGADLCMPFLDVQWIDKLNQYLLQEGKNCELLMDKNGYSFVVVDEEGKQVAFEEVIKGLFD